MSDDRRIIHEITPLMGKDVLYIADRHKKEFTYPIHNHSVFELNFVENAKGVRRIVGDSQEIIGDYDLCLITSPDLEHVWEQNDCRSEDIREITIQFDFSMSTETLFGRNPYSSITRMMQEAKKGLVFPMKAIMKVYGLLDTLSSVKDGFYAVQQFLTILYELSRCDGAKTLASTSYAKVTVEDDSRRILKVKNYISNNYMDELRLPELASMAGMSPSAFSRFFKLHTGRNISEYIIDLRLGYAARMLVDTFPGNRSGLSVKRTPTGSTTTPCSGLFATSSAAAAGRSGPKISAITAGKPWLSTAGNWPASYRMSNSCSTSSAASGTMSGPMPLKTACPSSATCPCSSLITVPTAGLIRTSSTSMKQGIRRLSPVSRLTTSVPTASSGAIPSMITRPWPGTTTNGGPTASAA